MRTALFIVAAALALASSTFAQEHTKDSTDQVKKAIPKGSFVYLHCKAGGRCLSAAEILKKQGYDARPLKDGFDDLVKAGFPKAEK